MSSKQNLLDKWLSFTRIHAELTNELDKTLQTNHQTTLNEFYVLFFLAQSPEKKLRLIELQRLVGLSQSAMSRLTVRLENKSCGVIKRMGFENDRRGVCASITERGEARLQEILVTVTATLERSFGAAKLDDLISSLAGTGNAAP